MTSIKSLLDEIFEQANPENNHDSDLYYFYSERRGPHWFAAPYESRWFGDTGEYLGKNGIEALDTIKRLGFTIHKDIATKIKNKCTQKKDQGK